MAENTVSENGFMVVMITKVRHNHAMTVRVRISWRLCCWASNASAFADQWPLTSRQAKTQAAPAASAPTPAPAASEVRQAWRHSVTVKLIAFGHH